MGQYYYVVNLDKKQFLHPHRFGDGLKLMELVGGSAGVLGGLAVLLADGNGRGGGDLRSDNPVVGSWAGDRVVVTGDYADQTEEVEYGKENVFTLCSAGRYEDISEQVIDALCDDPYLEKEFERKARTGYFRVEFPRARTSEA